ncbi:Pam3-gp28 family putative phage holin [Psychrobacter celer]|uniref:Pam3-gp28 family putative phage holin n=1 Tax=Psychrobacter celer TaxID=306572 RepID=UPI003FCFC664
MEKQDSVLFPIIRYSLIGLGTNFVQSGVLNAAQLETVVGAVMTLGATAWLIFNKKYKHKL